MKVLIIYENIPETTDVYLVDVTDKDWKWMQRTHRCYINTEMPPASEKACTKLSLWLDKREKSGIGTIVPIDVKKFGVDTVLITGFAM